jgi:hypothetical protein
VGTVVATANVLRSLDTGGTRTTLGTVLVHRPDVVCLQEWSLRRLPLLRETGTVISVPAPGRTHRPRSPRGSDYLWVSPVLGGCPVGVRSDRYDVLSASSRLLAGPGRSDPRARPLPVAPARFATLVLLRDLVHGGEVAVLGYHLTPGVQGGGVYREDRPHLVARHRRETATLDRLVAAQLARGRVVHAAGDSNLHGFRLAGLTSAWDGRPPGPGTHGRHRRIDDVLGPGPALDVELVVTQSDHRAVLVGRA